MSSDSRFLIRPVETDDLDRLYDLVTTVPDSITSLQPDKTYLERRIDDSLRSFYPKIYEPGLEKYMFVLIDQNEGRIAGTSSMYARTGGFEPFYTYEITQNVFRYKPLEIENPISELHLRLTHDGPSELGGLYLHDDYRGAGVGGALSRCRFMLARLFPKRFTRNVLTEFRGVVTEQGTVPFWEALGRHFFSHDFDTLDQYSATSRKDFIQALMPKHPIYIPLLPESAQEVIGKPHPKAEPAVHVLQKEGFQYINQVDIFDAGPIYRAEFAGTRTVSSAIRGKVKSIVKKLDSPKTLVSNTKLAFRATVASIENDEGEVTIDKQTASDLNLKRGDGILFLPTAK